MSVTLSANILKNVLILRNNYTDLIFSTCFIRILTSLELMKLQNYEPGIIGSGCLN